MSDIQKFSVRGFGNRILGRAFQPSILRTKASLERSLVLFDRDFKVDPDEAVASVLINHFDAIDLYAGLADYVSATHEFQIAWYFLNELLARPGLETGQYHAITRGARRWQSEWAIYRSYVNEKVPETSQIASCSVSTRKWHEDAGHTLH